MNSDIKKYFQNIKLPDPQSHKGQNGKLMIIGGSELFHAASRWSLDIASKFVDMVFYSSVPVNNQLILEAKKNFLNGIVIPRDEIENYIDEADCVLIGPGMTRSDETKNIINNLLKKFKNKKWVIDAGALQMVDSSLLNKNCIITPHKQEFNLLLNKRFVQEKKVAADTQISPITLLGSKAMMLSKSLDNLTILLKGQVDLVVSGDRSEFIAGGNAGMTKGGTGDVLAGLVAALYCSHDAVTSCVVASYINKKAGEYLWEQVGPYFNASDLVDAVPKILWGFLKK